MNALSRLCVTLCTVGILFPGPASAAENNLTVRPSSPPQIQEAPVVRPLPDQPDINISLPNSTAPNVHIIERTSPDVNVITPENPDINVVQPKGTTPDVNVITPEKPDVRVVQPNGTAPNVTITEQPAQGVTVNTPGKPDVNVVPPQGTAPNVNVITPEKQDVHVVRPNSAAPDVTVSEPKKTSGPVQLWELIPLTPVKNEKPEKATAKTQTAVPDKKPEPKKTAAQKAPQPEKISVAKQATPPRPPQPAPVKPEKKAEPKPEKKTPPKPEPSRKSRPGEQLRIPPEAVQTGRLDFLEGCWQGTRPEYFSKRIVRECFCFGPQGSYGRRTVIDPSGRRGGRTCTGTTRAHMEGSTLRVSSSGAYCSDGERWGAAQMMCRGSGQNTPCSWIFTDANGGRQSYEIPFVRVESCGRRR